MVRILPIDVYGSNPATTTFDVGRGIYAAAEAGPTVINLSLGTDSNSPFLYRLIQDVSNQGVLVVAAAGNQPVTTPVYPAAYPEVLAVTASDRAGPDCFLRQPRRFRRRHGPGHGGRANGEPCVPWDRHLLFHRLYQWRRRRVGHRGESNRSRSGGHDSATVWRRSRHPTHA